ncbi:MAG: hypothetical protein HKN81_04745 [Gammaproteobacteria bacterium]|nr:hypothetical protein [Gammaproteobacteria bacterium]NND36425.1 hypothetical protein [Gammaproteobacteria bacterium]
MRRVRNRLVRGLGIVFVLATAALLSACDSIHESKDFERHRYSQLSEPRDRDDVLYFDVKFDANYPEDNDVAEEIRMEWLEAWLKQRKMCNDGYGIDSKRPFDAMEYNPGQYDRRYIVECKVVEK